MAQPDQGRHAFEQDNISTCLSEGVIQATIKTGRPSASQAEDHDNMDTKKGSPANAGDP